MPTENRSSNTEQMISCDDGLHLIQLDENLSHYGWVFRKVESGWPYSVRKATEHEMAHAKARQHLRTGAAQIAVQYQPATQFDGDNATLISSINFLLALDAKGALVPNGVCGLARQLLEASTIRLAAQLQGEPVGEVVAFGESLHEIAWAQGKLPRLGTKLYTSPPTSDGFSAGDMADQGAKAFAARDPEVEELRELLRAMTCGYRMAVQAGHARITALGGDCDGVDRMLADFPEYAKAIAATKRQS
ncbi:hypothetical protein [Pseudomonas vranovensis]|uniref:hypothetical protein n=1 Tax=Pseudomonas vranovensis TaxID=321661 RepID=UPI00048FCB34|nr:hypothetical protein [Pseudomonas vranovensis]